MALSQEVEQRRIFFREILKSNFNYILASNPVSIKAVYSHKIRPFQAFSKLQRNSLCTMLMYVHMYNRYCHLLQTLFRLKIFVHIKFVHFKRLVNHKETTFVQ
jgi:hypothetical protein